MDKDDVCHIGHQHRETIPSNDATLEILFCHTLHWDGAGDAVDFEQGAHHETVRSVVYDMVIETLTLIPAFLCTLEDQEDCVNVVVAPLAKYVV